MVKYGVWLVAGIDHSYPQGSWCWEIGEFKGHDDKDPHFSTEDVNLAYRYREYISGRFKLGNNAYEVKEYGSR